MDNLAKKSKFQNNINDRLIKNKSSKTFKLVYMYVLCIEIKYTENVWKDIHKIVILGRILRFL